MRELMLEQTIRLFIRALIIGILIHIGLQHIATIPALTTERTTLQHQIPLPQSSTSSEDRVFDH
jgi:hypothetical protein